MAGKNQSLVPFGKYRGQPVEVLLADGDYVEWIMGQPGLVQKLQREYPVLFNIITVGAPQTDDTPDHNRLQARFLDNRFQEAFFSLAHGKSLREVTKQVEAKWRSEQEAAIAEQRERAKREVDQINESVDYYKRQGDKADKSSLSYHTERLEKAYIYQHHVDYLNLSHLQPPTPLIFRPEFECGYDVRLEFGWQQSTFSFEDVGYYGDHKVLILDPWINKRRYEFRVEIKPQMGDDFPGVLRQMKNNGADVLCLGQFEAAGATLEQVRAMFGEQQKIVLIDEIEDIAAGLTTNWQTTRK